MRNTKPRSAEAAQSVSDRLPALSAQKSQDGSRPPPPRIRRGSPRRFDDLF